MSLLSTIQLANNSLVASQIGLQVAGNNIANADTPGYIRQEAVFTPAPTEIRGRLVLGLGVKVAGIVQKVDTFLNERLRGALGDLESSAVQEQTYIELESVLGELGETDLSSALTSFFGSISDVLNQPEDVGVRNRAVRQGDALVGTIQRIDSRVSDIRSKVNVQIEDAAGDINRLLEQIADLNTKIVQTERNTPAGGALGLRDQRGLALEELASLVGVRTIESENGSVDVFAAGEFLVSENGFQPVGVRKTLDRGIAAAEIVIERSQAPLRATSGRLAGLYAARDDILVGFLDQLDNFTNALTSEFNKVYSSGQGLTGFTDLTAAHGLEDETEPLDQAGLTVPPINGSFQIQVRNTQSGVVETNDLFVDLNGLDEDTSLIDLVASIDAVEGIAAELTAQGRLRISADTSNVEFSFANDTSGVLASLGLNVFFTGSSPADLAVSSLLASDASKFAASQGGIGNDTENAALLTGFESQSLESHQGQSVTDLYDAIVVQNTQASAVRHAVTDGFRVFHGTLESQHLATSGVSIDDEAIKVIRHQRMYQASARVISTVADLLDTLINL